MHALLKKFGITVESYTYAIKQVRAKVNDTDVVIGAIDETFRASVGGKRLGKFNSERAALVAIAQHFAKGK